jgi:hypothetical protein
MVGARLHKGNFSPKLFFIILGINDFEGNNNMLRNGCFLQIDHKTDTLQKMPKDYTVQEKKCNCWM